MSIFDRQQIKQTILDFASSGVQTFRQNNPGLVFNAFAFDCNAEYAEINLCFNTEEGFSKTLNNFRKKNPKDILNEEEVLHFKYNTGNWVYQCFDTTNILTDAQLDEIFQTMPDDDYQTWEKFIDDLKLLFTESLQSFIQTEIYKNIPKTKDFITYCIDHDETVEIALKRMNIYA